MLSSRGEGVPESESKKKGDGGGDHREGTSLDKEGYLGEGYKGF